MINLNFKQSEDFDFFGYIKAFDGEVCIGIAKLSRNENVAALGDIIVYNNKKRRVFNFLPIYSKTNYRQKGVGTKLLQKTIIFCKEKGITEIKGKAMGDLDIIIPWYTKNGFTVNKENEIHMNLHP